MGRIPYDGVAEKPFHRFGMVKTLAVIKTALTYAWGRQGAGITASYSFDFWHSYLRLKLVLIYPKSSNLSIFSIKKLKIKTSKEMSIRK